MIEKHHGGHVCDDGYGSWHNAGVMSPLIREFCCIALHVNGRLRFKVR